MEKNGIIDIFLLISIQLLNALGIIFFLFHVTRCLILHLPKWFQSKGNEILVLPSTRFGFWCKRVFFIRCGQTAPTRHRSDPLTWQRRKLCARGWLFLEPRNTRRSVSPPRSKGEKSGRGRTPRYETRWFPSWHSFIYLCNDDACMYIYISTSAAMQLAIRWNKGRDDGNGGIRFGQRVSHITRAKRYIYLTIKTYGCLISVVIFYIAKGKAGKRIRSFYHHATFLIIL